MATPPTPDGDDLPALAHAILDELHEGDRTRGALVDATGRDTNTVGSYLEDLEERGIVRKIHARTALWTLEYDPRADDHERDEQ